MDNTVLIIGAGFSKVSGIPLTRELTDKFLTLGETQATPQVIQDAISNQLSSFWQKVFNYRNDGLCPTFEDHFTLIDLAANTGHSLGSFYTPTRLRGIRRLSIHRVFDILDSKYHQFDPLREFLRMFSQGSENSIISTNWDIVVEKHLAASGSQYDYLLPMTHVGGGTVSRNNGLPLLKLQGSSNWAYCDTCRKLFEGPLEIGKSILHSWTFLEERDFKELSMPAEATEKLRERTPSGCPGCHAPRLSARVATFSYNKAYSFFQFQAVWENALRKLRDARRWIFIGYSLPEADFELRQLLKTAQLGNRNARRVWIEVVIKDDCVVRERYIRFFGVPSSAVSLDGFEAWLADGAGS